MLEEGSFYGRTVDYAWMLLLSALSLLVSATTSLRGEIRHCLVDRMAIKSLTLLILTHPLSGLLVPLTICVNAVSGITSGVYIGVHLVTA
jgi:hypothetical protein